MRIITKLIAMIRYKKDMKKTTKQLDSFMEVYERNEKRIQEIKELITKDNNKYQ